MAGQNGPPPGALLPPCLVAPRVIFSTDMMKSVVDKLSKIQNTQEKIARTPQPVGPPLVVQQAAGPAEYNNNIFRIRGINVQYEYNTINWYKIRTYQLHIN